MWILLVLETGAVGLCPAENPNRIRPLADEFVTVCRFPDPKTVYCYTPGICRLDSGRLVATCDFGGKGVKKGEPRGRIFVSDDRGLSWRQTGTIS